MLYTESSESVLDASQLESVKEIVKKTTQACQFVSSEHKVIHFAISKFGKAIDKVGSPL